MNDGELSRLFLHSEDHADVLPPLFLPTQAEIEQQTILMQRNLMKNIAIGYASGTIKKIIDSAGYAKYALLEKDRFGDEVPLLYFTEKLITAHSTIDQKGSQDLIRLTSGFKDSLNTKEQRDKMIEELHKLILLLKEESGADSPEYGLYKQFASELMDSLN